MIVFIKGSFHGKNQFIDKDQKMQRIPPPPLLQKGSCSLEFDMKLDGFKPCKVGYFSSSIFTPGEELGRERKGGLIMDQIMGWGASNGREVVEFGWLSGGGRSAFPLTVFSLN